MKKVLVLVALVLGLLVAGAAHAEVSCACGGAQEWEVSGDWTWHNGHWDCYVWPIPQGYPVILVHGCT